MGFDFKHAVLGVVGSFDDMVGFQHVLTIYQTLLGCMYVNCYVYSAKPTLSLGLRMASSLSALPKILQFWSHCKAFILKGSELERIAVFHDKRCHAAFSAFACTCHGLGFRLTSLFLKAMYSRLIAFNLQPDTLHPNPRGPSTGFR